MYYDVSNKFRTKFLNGNRSSEMEYRSIVITARFFDIKMTA